MNYEDLPARLSRIINLSQFAERSGIPRRTLYTVMRGTNSPNLATCEKIARKLKEIKPQSRPATPKARAVTALEAA